MPVINTYLTFMGNTEEAFNFYKTVFGGEFSMVMRFKDVPAEFQQEGTNGEKIMHISLPIGTGTVLMGSDSPDTFPPLTIGNNTFISVSTDSEEETNQIFNKLAEGGKTTMPLEKTFWNAYFGMLVDKYGVQWMVSYDFKENQN